MARRIGRAQLKASGRRYLTRVGKILPTPASGRVVVLCYHSIHPTSFVSCASPELFDEHLQWLSTECECVPFSAIAQRLAAPASRKPVVAVTFDDGYADNHENALPLLAKWGVPATFFVTAGLVEKDPAVLGRFRRLVGRPDEGVRPLAWAQVRELRESGMEIGAHTYRHPNLALLEDREVNEELKRSKQVLEERLGVEVTTMAYPFGKPRRHVTPAVVAAAGRLGFRLAASILHRGVRRGDDLLQIPRFTILHDPVDTLKARVHGVFDLVGLGQQYGPLWAGRLTSPQDFRFGT